jgi:hypothetical protein
MTRRAARSNGMSAAGSVARMAAQPHSCLTFELAPDANRPTCCRVVLAKTGGWDVCLEIDGHVVSFTHCEDWHRVERMCDEIYMVWTDTHTEPSARR